MKPTLVVLLSGGTLTLPLIPMLSWVQDSLTDAQKASLIGLLYLTITGTGGILIWIGKQISNRVNALDKRLVEKMELNARAIANVAVALESNAGALRSLVSASDRSDAAHADGRDGAEARIHQRIDDRFNELLRLIQQLRSSQ